MAGDNETPPYLKFDANLNPMNLGEGKGLVGSLTGAVACKRVTQASKGALSTDGNRAVSAKAKERLTARPTSQAGAKAGFSDPPFPRGRGGA